MPVFGPDVVTSITWPTTLPQLPISPGQQAPKYSPAQNAIRSSVDSGPAKQRRRFTAVPETVSIQMILTEGELAILENFIVNTVQYVLPFTWVDFRSGNPAVYRLLNGKKPDQEHYGDVLWMASMDLEKLP